MIICRLITDYYGPNINYARNIVYLPLIKMKYVKINCKRDKDMEMIRPKMK